MEAIAFDINAKNMPIFPLGEIVATPTAFESVSESEIKQALARHSSGDWGELDAEDQRSNRRALETGARILSAYQTGSGKKFWIITEANRYATTVLLPEDY